MKKTFSIIALIGIMFFLFVVFDAEAKPQRDELRKLLEQEDARIPDLLEGLYPKGVRVPRYYNKPVKWWRMAAERGDAYAQRVLGEMYYHGEGVPQDFVRAYVWISLAAAQDTDYAKMRDIVLKSMTPQQIGSARKLSIKVQNKIGQKTKGDI